MIKGKNEMMTPHIVPETIATKNKINLNNK